MNLKNKLTSVFIALAMTLMLALPVLAQTWIAYYPTIVIDSSGGGRTALPVITGIEGQSLIDAGVLSSSGLDSRMRLAGTDIPYMISETQIPTYLDSLPAFGQAQVDLYTGYSVDATDFDIITGEDGFITIDDTADVAPQLELGNDFEIELSGYVDTTGGADVNLVYKQAAFRTYIDGATNITSEAYHDTSDTIYLLPNAAGDATGIEIMFPDTGEAHWEDVDDPVGAPDEAATYVSSSNNPTSWDYYNLTAPVWLGDVQTITTVKVTYRARHADANATQHATVRLAAVDSSDETHVFGAAFADHTTATLARPGGGTWAAADFDTLQVGLGLSDNGLADPLCTQTYVEVEYTYAFEVTATGIDSGEHTVKTVLHNNVFSIQIDEDVPDTRAAVGVTVPDNDNDWIINQNNVMPWMDYFFIWN